MGRPDRALLFLLPSLLLLSLFPASLYGAVITFNLAFESNCTEELGGCDFTNASIWQPPQVPGSNDTAIIAGSNANTSLSLFLSLPLSLGSLTVDLAEFVITDVTSLSMSGSVALGDGGNLVLVNSTLSSSSPSSLLSLAAGSSISSSAGGAIAWEGASQIYGNLILSGPVQLGHVTVYALSTTSSVEVVQVSSLNVTAGVAASFPNGLESSGNVTLANTSSLSVENTFSGQIRLETGSSMQIQNVNPLTITGTNVSAPVSGGGSLVILGSQIVNITALQTTLFSGNFTVNGSPALYFTNLDVPNLNFEAGSSVTLVADGLVIGSNATVLSITAIGAGVTIAGNVIAQGVLVNSSSLSVTGNFAVPSVVFTGTSQVLLGGVLQTNLAVPVGTELSVTSSKGTIVGSVANWGTVAVSEAKELEIIGNYEQFPNATLQVTLTDDDTSALAVVNGSIALNGSVQFTISDKPLVKSEKYVIASADYGINGTFLGSATALEGSAVDRDLAVEYESNKVSIVYDFHIKDVEIWMWIVVSVVVVLLIVATIAVIIKCRKRASYEML